MKKMIFGLVASVAFSINANANVVSPTSNPKEITKIVLDGKSYSPIEFNQLDRATIEAAKSCTVTVTVTVNTDNGPQTLTTTETFEASWFGCAMAKVGAFLAGLWEPSI